MSSQKRTRGADSCFAMILPIGNSAVSSPSRNRVNPTRTNRKPSATRLQLGSGLRRTTNWKNSSRAKTGKMSLTVNARVFINVLMIFIFTS